MKYQAVARDNSGEVMVDKQIDLKVSLHGELANDETFYIEEHSVTTNKLGLFTLTIGEGYVDSGVFEDVPWSTRDVWMRVAISQDGGNEYTLISESRMLSVPYAFHAATAAKLVEKQDGLGPDDGDGTTPDPGSNSNNWHTDGNIGTDSQVDFLGTTDVTDLIIITNYVERINVTADGDVLMANNVRVGKNLEVRDTVWLNTDRAEGGDGVTIVFGDFTVDSLSPTLLSGTLDVDGKTDLNSKLNVWGVSDFNNSVNVNMGFPTHLSGTLLVNGVATFTDTTNSTHQSNGSVTIDGGVGIDSNLFVGGNFDVRGSSAFGGPVGFESVVTISDSTQSTNVGNGALVVHGGVGLRLNLNVGEDLNVGKNTDLSGTLNVIAATTLNDILTVAGATQINNTLDVTGATALGSTLGVHGITTLDNELYVLNGSKTTLSGNLDVSGLTNIANSTTSNTVSDGALVVLGGAGIGGKLNVGGAMKVNNTFTVKTSGILAVNPSSTSTPGHVAMFENTSNGGGIAIKVGAATPSNTNNFITFLNSSGGMVGRIEGETTANFSNNQEYKDDVAFLSADVAFAVVNGVIGGLDLVQAGFKLTASLTSATACVGFGVCVTVPIVSFVVESGANVILEIAQGIMLVAEIVKVSANLGVYIATHETLKGITFASGSGDYAEYLPRLDPSEVFTWGDVVGMKNGYITKNTIGADRIMVISYQPIVLGAVPEGGNEADYEKVAFLGQVPTKVMGKANKGDYILSSGFHNGFGVPRHPDHMVLSDYDRILGIAWEDSGDDLVNVVNVAIGLNTNDLTHVLKDQAQQIEDQQSQIDGLESKILHTNDVLAELVPGFKEAAGLDSERGPVTRPATDASAHNDAGNHAYAEMKHDRTSGEDIIYHEVTAAEIDAMFVLARQAFEEGGISIETNPFWQRIDNEPAYKQEVVRELEEKFEKAAHTHQNINDQLGGN
ncbi:MAG: hypothetical protein DRI69_04510 [Bacteroidetes bacterium]|nr:MAG: hypothetical protein DRI69_04510 [Bacteroidota bacterium]